MKRISPVSFAGLLTVTFALALVLSAAPKAPQASAGTPSSPSISLRLDPEHSTVHWTVGSTLHIVRGTFQVEGGTIQFWPKTGKAVGEVIVSAKSGTSDNNSRDSRMHKEILETAKYPDAAFRPAQVEGAVQISGASDVKLHGIFSLHGSDHEITAPVHVEFNGNRWKGPAQFDVPYVAWGIKDPSNLLLKVKKVVHVEAELAGNANSPSAE